MVGVFLLIFSLHTFGFQKVYAQAKPLSRSLPPVTAPKKARAVRPNVEIFSRPNFDSDIIEYIQPGLPYLISSQKRGAFYRIKVNEKTIGYISDAEIDIEGEGRLTEKPFIDDPGSTEGERVTKNSTKKNKSALAQDDDDEDAADVVKNSYHGLVLNLINYHEKTMDQEQVADMFAIGYRYIPFLSDYSSSLAWDVNAAIGIPKYYKDKINASGDGVTIWSGVQFVNISVIDRNKTIRYGLGPFLKYSNYAISVAQSKYSLQELNLGFLLEGGFVYHTNLVSFDVGLRFYWEKQNYGGLSLGFLF